jgi:hypothetical protein
LLIAPVLTSKGLIREESDDVKTIETQVEGDGNAPPNAPFQSSISEAFEFIQVPEATSRGAVCSETLLKTKGLNLNYANDSRAHWEIKNHSTSIR